MALLKNKGLYLFISNYLEKITGPCRKFKENEKWASPNDRLVATSKAYSYVQCCEVRNNDKTFGSMYKTGLRNACKKRSVW